MPLKLLPAIQWAELAASRLFTLAARSRILMFGFLAQRIRPFGGGLSIMERWEGAL